MPINKEKLQARKQVSSTRPKFVRPESWRYKRLETTWRKPKGVDKNKLTAFEASEVVTGASSSATGTIASLTNPEIDYYSGSVIYAEDRSPITRATDQTENIKLIVEF